MRGQARLWTNVLALLALFAAACFIIYVFSPKSPRTVDSNNEVAKQGNHSQIITGLHQLCDDFADGLISGDLCNRLCYYSNFTVTDFWVRQKSVAILQWGGQRLVLKSRHLFLEEFGRLPNFTKMPQEVFLSKVLDVVNGHLALNWPRERIDFLLEMIWPSYRRSHALSPADKRSIWLLIQQEEYLTFSVLQLADLFPKIMGTCGHLYAAEYVIPFKLNSFFYGNLRPKILLHLSGTLKLMCDFLNEPLHWCDVRFDNLGLSADYPKRFMLMDADLVFTESRMNALMKSIKCQSDSDCQYSDCVSKCDNHTKTCTVRTNDNIEVFCKKLIRQLYGDFWTPNNKMLGICHDIQNYNLTQRLTELQAFWVWNLSEL